MVCSRSRSELNQQSVFWTGIQGTWMVELVTLLPVPNYGQFYLWITQRMKNLLVHWPRRQDQTQKTAFMLYQLDVANKTLNTSHHRSKKYAQIWKIPFRYNLKDTKNQRLNTNQGIKWSHCDCYLILTESSSHFLAWHTGLNKLACGWGIYSHSSSFTAGVSFDHFRQARTQSWAPRL